MLSEEKFHAPPFAITAISLPEKSDAVAKKIDAIYVQERTDKTDEQCKAAKEA